MPAAPVRGVSIAAGLERKLAAACAYASQIGFQFGGPEACARALRELASREGDGRAAELFVRPDAASRPR